MPDILITGGGRLGPNAGGQVVLDANGEGTVEVRVPGGQVWTVQRMTVSCTGPTSPMPACYVYDGPPSDAYLLDATWTGTQDVSDFGQPLDLVDGDYLTFHWTGGTAGETATARLVGTFALRR